MSTATRTSVFSFVGALSVLLHIPQTQSLPSWSCGCNVQLAQLVGRFWVFFLSHTATGFKLWLYFHCYVWVTHLGLLLSLPWRTWVCPCEGQAWRWCSCLGRRDSGSTRYSGELVARASGNSALEGYGNRCWPIHSCSLAWRIPLTEKTTVHRVAKSPAPPKWPSVRRHRTFFACGGFAPLRAEDEGGTVAWLARTLVTWSIEGHRLPLLQELWPYQSIFFFFFFCASCGWR